MAVGHVFERLSSAQPFSAAFPSTRRELPLVCHMPGDRARRLNMHEAVVAG
jgi:hypothetical protein